MAKTPTQAAQRRLEYVPLDELVPAERNPKRHDLPAIGRSIDRFGYVEPIVLDERTGRLVAGHGRLGDYHSRHEPLLYGWKPGAAHHAVPDRSQDTVWEIPRPKRSAEHPTMKPVALITRALENSTDHGAVVLDPFAGSGSTLIACHGTGRLARLIELDPAYCDVICRRYQEHTGDKPILEATGEPHDFTAG